MGKSREESASYQDHRELSEDLDRQYHEIGIPALVAALRYGGEAPAAEKTDHPADSQGRAA